MNDYAFDLVFVFGANWVKWCQFVAIRLDVVRLDDHWLAVPVKAVDLAALLVIEAVVQEVHKRIIGLGNPQVALDPLSFVVGDEPVASHRPLAKYPSKDFIWQVDWGGSGKTGDSLRGKKLEVFDTVLFNDSALWDSEPWVRFLSYLMILVIEGISISRNHRNNRVHEAM